MMSGNDSRRSFVAFLKAFMRLPAARSVTAPTLVQLFLTSMRLLPVALAAQFVGIAALAATYWYTSINEFFLWIWASFGIVQIYGSLWFVRSFWRDADRRRRIRLWIRRWTILAAAAGIIWGVAGTAFLVPAASGSSGILQVVTVAVIVGVTFASWPAYSVWMPSLTAFTLLSLAPMTIAVAAQYRVSQIVMALVILTVTVFILYSGRRLNEMLVSSILMDAENRRLVERLKKEVSRSEAARRTTQAESERRAKFFAAANHDLRQPLQAMGIYLDILKRRATPQTEPVIGQLAATSKSIATLVEQVLEVTRMEFGRLELHPEVIDVAALLDDIALEFRPVAEKKGLVLRVKRLDAVVKTDPLMLRRALNNLVTNAIRYTDKPGGEIVVAARRVGKDRISIGVYDSGPGLSKEEQKRIFETFWRGSAAKSGGESGFGLGLSIVKGIAKQLGVELSVGSHVGRGSVFRLVLDVAEADQVRLLTSPRRVGQGDAEPIRTFAGTAALLEDNIFVQEAVASTLQGWGAVVIKGAAPDEDFFERAAAASREAGAALPAPFVLVTDYNLGESVPTGLAAAGMLEAKAGRPVPAVLLTAVARDLIESDYAEAVKSGLPHPEKLPYILQKPCSAAMLAAAVAAALSDVCGQSADEAQEAPAAGKPLKDR